MEEHLLLEYQKQAVKMEFGLALCDYNADLLLSSRGKSNTSEHFPFFVQMHFSLASFPRAGKQSGTLMQFRDQRWHRQNRTQWNKIRRGKHTLLAPQTHRVKHFKRVLDTDASKEETIAHMVLQDGEELEGAAGLADEPVVVPAGWASPASWPAWAWGPAHVLAVAECQARSLRVRLQGTRAQFIWIQRHALWALHPNWHADRGLYKSSKP